MNPWVAFAIGVIGTFSIMSYLYNIAVNSWMRRGDLICSEWLKRDAPRMCKNSK